MVKNVIAVFVSFIIILLTMTIDQTRAFKATSLSGGSFLATSKSSAGGPASTAVAAAASTSSSTPSSIAESIQQLSQQRKSLVDLSDKECCVILQEMLDIVAGTEWETADDWLQKEAELMRMLERDADTNDVVYSAHNHRVMSLTRQLMGQHVAMYCKTLKEALEYRIKQSEASDGSSSSSPPKAPKLVETVRTDKDVNKIIYGPLTLASSPGHSMEIWCDTDGNDGKMEMAKTGDGNDNGVCVVLGAGNQSFLSIIDTFHCIFSQRYPVILKHHPLRPYCEAPVRLLLEPLIKRGYLQQIPDCGVEATQTHILGNPLIQHVHVTGAWTTAQAIEKTLAKARPSLQPSEIHSMVTTELGGVGPFVVTPAEYTDAELRNAAKIVVVSRLLNRGANCLSSQALIMAKDWPQNKEFRDILMEECKLVIKDPVYYPGTAAKRKQLYDAYAAQGKATVVKAEKTSCTATSKAEDDEEDDDLVVVECGTPNEDGYNDAALFQEAFGPVLAIVELAGGDKAGTPDQFLVETVLPFLNDKSNILGTLVASVIHPASVTELPSEFIAKLRYNALVVNTTPILSYTPSACSGGKWGGHDCDVDNPRGSSGRGYVGNLFGLKNIEKSVIYGPPLTTAPLLDLSKSVPPVLLDVFHVVGVANSPANAIFRILKTLLGSLFQRLIPKSVLKFVFGPKAEKPVGGPF